MQVEPVDVKAANVVTIIKIKRFLIHLSRLKMCLISQSDQTDTGQMDN